MAVSCYQLGGDVRIPVPLDALVAVPKTTQTDKQVLGREREFPPSLNGVRVNGVGERQPAGRAGSRRWYKFVREVYPTPAVTSPFP